MNSVLTVVDFMIQVKPWVKTSLAPGSRVVEKYLDRRCVGVNTISKWITYLVT